MNTYIIQDWTGKTCFDGKEFSDFETAWGFIREQIEGWLAKGGLAGEAYEEAYNEWCGEFYVEEKSKLNRTNFP